MPVRMSSIAARSRTFAWLRASMFIAILFALAVLCTPPLPAHASDAVDPGATGAVGITDDAAPADTALDAPADNVDTTADTPASADTSASTSTPVSTGDSDTSASTSTPVSTGANDSSDIVDTPAGTSTSPGTSASTSTPVSTDSSTADGSATPDVDASTVSAATAPAASADSTRTVADGAYNLVSAINGTKLLDVSDNDASNPTNVQTYDPEGNASQSFYITYDTATGYYKLLTGTSGLALDAYGGGTSNGTNVWVCTSNDTLAQRWSIVRNADGTFSILSALSGLALDVSSGSSIAGTNVQLFASNSTLAQKWSLVGATHVLDDDYYRVAASGNASLLIDAGSGTDSDTPAKIDSATGSWTQEFYISADADGTVTMRSVEDGRYLGVSGSSAAGASIRLLAASASSSIRWNPIIVDGGIMLVLASDPSVALSISGSCTSGAALATDTASVADTLQRWQLAKVSPTIADLSLSVSDRTISPTAINGISYLFAPSAADIAHASITFSRLFGTGDAYVSRTAGGTWTVVQSGHVYDLTSLCALNASGAYDLYVRANPLLSTLHYTIMKSTGVLTLLIVSDDPATAGRSSIEASADRSATASGTLIAFDADGTVVYDGALDSIGGWGSASWNLEKKCYRIVLDVPTDLLSTGDAAEARTTWLLIAGSADSTLLHDQVAYDLARELGLLGSQGAAPLDLYYDGEYRGSYLLCEPVEAGMGRVDIDGDGDGESGYLVELDNVNYLDAEYRFKTSIGWFVVKSPDAVSDEKLVWLKTTFQNAIDNAGYLDDLSGFDVESLAKTYLVNELAGNVGYLRLSSTYFYIPYGQATIYAGPAEGFDSSFGTPVDGTDPEKHIVIDFAFYADCTAFKERVATLRASFQNLIGDVLLGNADSAAASLHSIAYYSARIASSQAMNQMLWGLGESSDSTVASLSTYQANVDAMAAWVRQRNAWLASALAADDQRTVSDGVYQISSLLDTNMAIDVEGGSWSNEANIQLYGANGTDAQLFLVRYVGDGYYTIMSMQSFKMLDVENADSANGTNVRQCSSNGTYAQQWLIRRIGGSACILQSRLNSLFLGAGSTVLANGTNIATYSLNTDGSEAFGGFGTNLLVSEYQVISDIQTGSAEFDGSDNFACALAQIRALSPNTSGIVIDGDLTEWSAQSEYDTVKRIIEQAGYSLDDFTFVMGNHEQRTDSDDYGYYRQLFCSNFGLGNVYYSKTVADQSFIVLGPDVDTDEGWCTATLSSAQLEWLEALLAYNQANGIRSSVFVHWPLQDTTANTSAYSDSQQPGHNLTNGDALKSILQRYSDLAVFTGHSHCEADCSDSSPLYVNTGSIAYIDDGDPYSTAYTGNQGWFVYTLADRVIYKARDFENETWLQTSTSRHTSWL